MVCIAFPLLLFIFSLSLIFALLIIVCLGMVLLELIMFGTLYFLDLDIWISRIGKFWVIMSSNKFSVRFSLFSPWDPYNECSRMLFQRSLKLSSSFYSFFCFTLVISIALYASLLIHSSVSFSVLLIPFSVVFISLIVFFVCLVVLYIF